MKWPSSVEQAAMLARASDSNRPQRPGRADSSSRRGPTSRSLLKATNIGLQTKAILRQFPDHEVPDGQGACSEKFFKKQHKNQRNRNGGPKGFRSRLHAHG